MRKHLSHSNVGAVQLVRLSFFVTDNHSHRLPLPCGEEATVEACADGRGLRQRLDVQLVECLNAHGAKLHGDNRQQARAVAVIARMFNCSNIIKLG